jgi:hypothetical protein
MNIINHLTIVGGAFFTNQMLWIIFIYPTLYIFIEYTGIDLVEWGTNHPGYVVAWNSFNDIVPYIITSLRQNFSLEPQINDKIMTIFGILYTILGVLVAWRWSGNIHLQGLIYWLLTLIVFMVRAGLLLNLSYKAYMIRHVILANNDK